MPKFELENSPLFPQENKPVLTAEDVKTIVKETGADVDDFVRQTFIVRKDLLQKIRDYAYTERVEQKEVINIALEAFFADKTDLLSAPVKPRQVHKKKG